MLKRLYIFLILFASFAACGEQRQDNSAMDTTAEENNQAAQTTTPDSAQKITQASAIINPTSGNKATGTVTFTKEGEGIKVVAELEGLTPGKHGFHIHEKGDCSAPDASSAGDHFNPSGHQHGDRGHDQSHEGDLGNLEANKQGRARLEFTSKTLTFEGANSILNRAVVVHQDADDLKSQPAGKSGARIACGVITQDNNMNTGGTGQQTPGNRGGAGTDSQKGGSGSTDIYKR